MTAIVVHETRPAAPQRAAWLQSLLAPAIKACRFQGEPPPVEWRPLGKFGGLSFSKELAPRGRVALASGHTWTRGALIGTFIHEAAHSLLEKHPAGGAHDERFGALLLTLLLRSAASEPGVMNTFHHFYDLQDGARFEGEAASIWQPRSLIWCLQTSEELAPLDLTAEQVAAEVARRHVGFITELEAAPARQAQAIAKQQRRAAEMAARVAALRASIQLWRWLAALAWAVAAVLAAAVRTA